MSASKGASRGASTRWPGKVALADRLGTRLIVGAELNFDRIFVF